MRSNSVSTFSYLATLAITLSPLALAQSPFASLINTHVQLEGFNAAGCESTHSQSFHADSLDGKTLYCMQAMDGPANFLKANSTADNYSLVLFEETGCKGTSRILKLERDNENMCKTVSDLLDQDGKGKGEMHTFLSVATTEQAPKV